MFLHRGWALWCIRKERTILLRKTMFSPRKNERKCQISRPSVAWIDDTRSGMRRHCKLWFRPKCTERDFRQLQNVPATIPLNLKFCLLISKSSHLKHVEVNCTWQSVFLHLYCSEKTSFWALQTGYSLFKGNSFTPPHFLLSTLDRVSTVAFTVTVSVLWRHFCEKVP